MREAGTRLNFASRMKRPFLSATALLALTTATAARAAEPALDYPPTRTVEHVDDYHGTKVADPYRWLEDANSLETQAWVEAQNQLTFGYLRAIPAREKIRVRVEQLWNYERFTTPAKQGGRYFFSKNSGLQNQNVIYTAPSPEAEPTLLLDPNKLSADGTVSLSSYSVSEDGRLMAYGVQTSGSDWIEWRVRDVFTGRDLPDKIEYSKFSGAAWTKDGRGFFYSRYDAPDEKTKLQSTNYFQKLYFHRIGTPQGADVLVYERKDQKEWGFGGEVTEDGKYLIITATQGTDPRTRVFYRPITAGPAEAPVVELLSAFDARYHFVGNDGATFYFYTNKDAARSRLVAVDVSAYDRALADWRAAHPAEAGHGGTLSIDPAKHPVPTLREVIPQAAETLLGVNYVGGRFVADYLKDAHSQAKVFTPDGKPVGEVPFPGLGTAAGFGGRADDPETFFSFTSYTTPTTVFRHDVRTGETKPVFAPKVAFDPREFTTEQVFFTSRDGTRVPVFLTYKGELKRDGTRPTLLYGYGGFDISLTPTFSPSSLVWMEMGGVYAVANLRGGGEYGEEWHAAGTRERKQNVFNDFIGAAEFLVSSRVTSTPKLAIAGGSNGGLLVGAAMTQRPDLFGAALPAVGVMDMLRFQRFTIGWAWASDYGSSDDPAMFPHLLAYSPLHHLKPGTCYPPTLVTTSDHDDRVVPAHSYKFAATLQAAQAQGCPNPVLIRIETKSGHGAGRPTSKLIEEAADRWAFLDHVLDLGVNRAAQAASPPVDVPSRERTETTPVPLPTPANPSR